MNTYGYDNWRSRPVETTTTVERFVYDKKGNVVEKVVTTTKTTTYEWDYNYYHPYTIPVIYSGSGSTTSSTKVITYNGDPTKLN